MISQLERSEVFFNNLEESRRKLGVRCPTGMAELQRQSLARAAQLGFPTIRDEEWKYTNIKPLLEHAYHFSMEAQLKESEPFSVYLNPLDINLVFVNGNFAPQYSTGKKLFPGLRICNLQEAFQREEIRLKEFFKRSNGLVETVFIALVKALATNGVYIEIADKMITDRVIHILHIVSAQDNLITTPYTIVKVGQSAQATILESYVSFDNQLNYFTDALTEIVIGENSTLKYCRVQGEGLRGYHIGATRVWQGRDSNFLSFAMTVGGQLSRHNLDVVINGEGANTLLNGLYCVNGTQLIDNHTLVDHRQPNATSRQFYKGILNGASHAVFNGKIFVKPIAQKTNSYQLNKNLLLGKACQVDTKPQLEIFADDVKCTHGVTIGQLNEDEIFYLQSRAIPRKSAIQMLSHGFVDEILETIQNDSVAQKYKQLLEPTFAALK